MANPVIPDETPYGLAMRAVIVDEQRRCLLLRRSKVCKAFVGTWEWPGGKVDAGESIDQALRREVREEPGLETKLAGVVGAYGFTMPDRPDRPMAVLCLEATPAGGELRLSEEHDEFSWVALTELKRWTMTPALKEFAVSYAAGLRSVR